MCQCFSIRLRVCRIADKDLETRAGNFKPESDELLLVFFVTDQMNCSAIQCSRREDSGGTSLLDWQAAYSIQVGPTSGLAVPVGSSG